MVRFATIGNALAVLAILFAATGCPCGPEDTRDYRQDMRDFVQNLSAYAKSAAPGFLIIPQNGEALLTANGETDGPPADAYLAAIDGQGREDLFFGYEQDNAPTPADATEEMLAYLRLAEQHQVQVLTTDYCSSFDFMDQSYAANAQEGFISFAADHRELDHIPGYPALPYQQNALNIASLAQAKNLLYLLNPDTFASRQEYLNALAETNYDILLIDFFFGDSALTAQEVAGLRQKANGGQRLLIAYMSIGEAEDYRYYWQQNWKPGNPEWLDEENPNWAGNYKVRYWDPGWQAIIFGAPNAYLDRIIAAGFNGVYLDIIDAYEFYEEQ